ncbi:MAG: hypothetical protein Q8O56_06810 [Solirubrobacteraceae bacterium]|nr:hypothetical protein [Solirubrobacteraceae bacterium]
MIRGLVFIAIGVILLVLSAVLFGLPPQEGKGPGTTAISPAELWDRISRGWKELRIPVATSVALLGLTLLLTGFRDLVLRVRQRTAAVHVANLVWEGERETSDPSAAYLTASLRRRLGELQFGANDALPGKAAGTASVQILDALSEVNPVARMIARLVPVVMPAAAYEVRGHARRSVDGKAEIVVDVFSVGRVRTELLSAAKACDDWAAAVRHAADAIAGTLIPHLRGRRSDPWTHWRTRVPEGLLGSYDAAAELRTQRQPEEALGCYRAALRHDPLNQAIRVSAGEVEEHLELFLDAWANYRTVAEETKQTRRPRSARRTREHTWYLGRYRLATLLGYGRAAAQWMRPESWDVAAREDAARTARDAERQHLRRELARSLADDRWLHEHGDERDAPSPWLRIRRATCDRHARKRWKRFREELEHEDLGGTADPLTLLCGDNAQRLDAYGRPTIWSSSALDDLHGVPRGLLIEELLQIVALRELRRMRRALVLGGPLRFVSGRGGVPLSASSLRVSYDWIELRIARTRYFRMSFQPSGSAAASAKQQYREEIERVLERWEKRRVRDAVLDRLTRRTRPRWLVYYNAACTLSIALLPVPTRVTQEAEPAARSPFEDRAEDDSTDERLVRAAMACLDRFVHLAGSARASTHTRWVIADDPDLTGLRMHPEFWDWTWRSFGLRRDSFRPRGAEVGLVTLTMLSQIARERAELWRARRDGSAVRATSQKLRWWREELALVEAMGTATREFRSWRHRLKALQRLRDPALRGAVAPLELRHDRPDVALDDSYRALLTSVLPRDTRAARDAVTEHLRGCEDAVAELLPPIRPVEAVQRRYDRGRRSDVAWPVALSQARVEAWTALAERLHTKALTAGTTPAR